MDRPEAYGKYLLIERVNVGGMAEVFKAMTVSSSGFQKVLAIKRVLPNISEDDAFVHMFVDEANIAGLLHHANIAQIYDLGSIDDTYFIAMEYVEGCDLRAIFDKVKKTQQPIPIDMAVFVASRLLAGLDYAHRKLDEKGEPLNIVHRDVSPPNVLLSYEGDVKLVDFGIAKAAKKASQTKAGVLKGKFGYMSPEQVRAMPVDGRSDIFSVGIVLFEMLAHKRLFLGETDFDTLEKVRNMEIQPPSVFRSEVPEELDRVVMRALERDVNKRYDTAEAMMHDLQRYLYRQTPLFTERSLADWMKETFAQELNASLERMRQIEDMDLSLLGIDLEAIGNADVTSLRGKSGHELESLSTHQPEDTRTVNAMQPVIAESRERRMLDQSVYEGLEQPPPLANTKTKSIILAMLLVMLAVVGISVISSVDAKVIALGNSGEGADVTFIANRVRASVYFKNQKLCDTPCRITDFYPGEQIVLFEKEGYLSQEKTVTITPGTEETIVGELYPPGQMPALLTVRSSPSGAYVYLDNQRVKGRTPLAVKGLNAGTTYSIEVSHDGYRKETRDIAVGRSGLQQEFVKLKPLSVSVRVDSIPPGAEIFVDGRNIDKKTPARIKGLKKGRAYSVLLVGADNERKRVTIVGDDENEPAITLLMREMGIKTAMDVGELNYGWLTIESDVSLRVSVDGAKNSEIFAPCVQIKLPKGEHGLQLNNPALNIDETRTVQIDGGKETRLNLSFR